MTELICKASIYAEEATASAGTLHPLTNPQWQWEAREIKVSTALNLPLNPSSFGDPRTVLWRKEVKVWEYNEQQGKWKVVYALSGHDDEIHDVAWAPNLG